MSCPNPIDPAVLSDYLIGELPAQQSESVEEHLFGCEDCSRELASIASLAKGIGIVAREKTVPFVISREFRDRLAREGLRIREYAPPAGGEVACTVTAQDDLLIGRLAADLSGVRTLDLALCDESGAERARLRDIPFQPESGEIVMNYPIGQARRLGPDVMVAKLFAIEPQGERLLAQYTFRHTPSA